VRTAFLGFAALTAALALHVAPANAQVPVSYPVYPWCTEYGGRGGATNCYFSTWDQCRAAASGNGGYCYRNPFYGYAGYPADQPGAARKYRRY
jgi:hypothetical protein